MKPIYKKSLAFLFSIFVVNSSFLFAQDMKSNNNNAKVTIEDIKQQCENLAYDKRVNLSVSSFNVATLNNPGQFGDELAQMLTNALQNVNCFNVRLSIKDMKAITDEQQFEQAGNTDETTNNEVGKIQAAQVIVMGKVTEFSQGEKKFQVLGVGGTGGNKAHVGFIIQLINAKTGMLIDSKSFNVDGKTSGFSGAQMFGVNVGGVTNNKSLQDACEKGVTQAVEYIASKKDQMPLPTPNNATAPKTFDASNCAVLSSSYIPKVMFIVPEYHLTRIVPDPAGETELNRKFIEAGFKVVDPAMFAAISQTAQFTDAAKDPMKAISLGKKFGADIVVYGEAFSELQGQLGSNQVSAVQNGNQVSVRGRVEVKAVRTDDATMLAANGMQAGATDNAEAIAGKRALTSAASQLADYLLGQFCKKNLSFSNTGASNGSSSSASSSAAGKTQTDITVNNVDYGKLKVLTDMLAAKGTVSDKTISNGVGHFTLTHSGATDAIADLINSKLGTKFNITDVKDGSINLTAK